MNRKKSITFMLPGRANVPVGGYKVICEYANRFVADGYEVSIVYPFFVWSYNTPLKYWLSTPARLMAWLTNGVSARKWFGLNPEIKDYPILNLDYNNVPKTDYYVATAIETASFLMKYPIDSNRKIYLIQGFENWNFPDEYVLSTYEFGFKNIAIAKWLVDKVKSSGNDCELIHNGFDFSYFSMMKPVQERDPLKISMLYHVNPVKGTKYGIEALKIVKSKYPDLKVTLFGVYPTPDDLPSWIRYVRRPNREMHNKIYNETSIFIAPSIQEGWGLTVGEAMICGATVVCTDAECFSEMVIPDETGLVSPVRDVEKMALNIIRLIEDDTLRISLSNNAQKHIKQFSWDNSYNKFKLIIEK